jgi:membrane dipeptidase
MTVDARELHAAAVVADTHNDLLMSVTARPPAQWGSFFREEWLPQLRDGGVDLQVLPVFVDGQDRGEGALRETLRMVEAAHRLAEHNNDAVAVCRDGAEIDAALATDRIALVLALEGTVGVGDNVELLETLWRLGVRVISLAHFGRTAFADGSGEDATGGRLTRAGLVAVALMERLGILLDISHLGAAGVEQALEVATRPVIATHSAARSLRDHHRNLTDEQITGVAAGGGIVCLNFFAPYLHETDHTLDRLVDHLAHMVNLVGAAHVGIGPDFILQVEMEVAPRWCDDFTVEGVDGRDCIPGLEGPRGLPMVTAAMLRHGFTEDEVRGLLGGNVLRLFRAELGVPGQASA